MKKYLTSSISLMAFLIFACIVYAGNEKAVRFPETEAGKRAESYFSAFNSSNENDMRTYLEQNIAPDNLKERPIEQRMAIYVHHNSARKIQGAHLLQPAPAPDPVGHGIVDQSSPG